MATLTPNWNTQFLNHTSTGTQPSMRSRFCCMRRTFAQDLSSPWSQIRIAARVSTEGVPLFTGNIEVNYGIGLVASSGGAPNYCSVPTGNFVGSAGPEVAATHAATYLVAYQRAAHRTGTTWTRSATNRICNVLNTVRRPFCVDITKGSPNWTIRLYYYSNSSQDNDVTDAQWAQIIDGSSDPATLNPRVTGVNETLADATIDEGTNGTLDQACFFTDNANAPLNVHDFAVKVLA